MNITDNLIIHGGLFPHGTLSIVTLSLMEYDPAINMTTIFFLQIGLLCIGLYWFGNPD